MQIFKFHFTTKGGPDNADKPFVWLKLEAIGNFEDSENVKTINKSLYNYLETEMNLEKVCMKKQNYTKIILFLFFRCGSISSIVG